MPQNIKNGLSCLYSNIPTHAFQLRGKGLIPAVNLHAVYIRSTHHFVPRRPYYQNRNGRNVTKLEDFLDERLDPKSHLVLNEYGIDVDFNMSPDSEFEYWQRRELYRQIMAGDIRLNNALLDSGNKVILEMLWDKVSLVNNQDTWDEERRKQLERGGQD
ncbi:hypothetical protein C8R42DRAFT_645679 [Lentinula raphanica]|nr:hypothetical protein C8R42DRAFT_645679 [Lentinula raphanica]